MVMHLIPEGEQRHTLDPGCVCRPEPVDLVAGQQVRQALAHKPSGETSRVPGARAVTRELLQRAGYSTEQIDRILDGPAAPPVQPGPDGDGEERYLTWTNLLRDGCTEQEAAGLLPGRERAAAPDGR